MRVVIDTSVVISAFRSSAGAAKEIVDAAFAGNIVWLLSNPLLLEYETVLSRPHQRAITGMSELEIAAFLDAVSIVADFIELGFYRRPTVRDANDEHVLNLVLRSRADMLITYNKRDFQPALPAEGVSLYSPAEALGFLRSQHARAR